MKNNVFTTIAAASIILGQVGQLSVFAQEMKPMNEDASITTNDKQNLSQKELLEMAILKAQQLELQAKKTLDQLTPAYQEGKKNYDAVNAAYQNRVSLRNQAQIQANDAIIQELEKQLAELEEKTGLLATSEKEKKELEEKLATVDQQLQEAQETLVTKQKELEDAVQNAEGNPLPEQIEKAQQAVEEAQKKLDTLKAEKESVEKEIASLSSTIEQEQTLCNKLTAELAQKQEALQIALAEKQKAEKAVEEAQKIYDATVDPVAKEQAQQELNQARDNLEAQKKNYAMIEKGIADTEQEILTTQQKIKDLKVEIQQVNDDIKRLEQLLGQENTELVAKQEELEQAKVLHQDKVTAYEQAQVKLTEAQTAVNDAQAKVQTETAKKEELESDIKTQEANLATLEQAAKDAQAQIAEGSRGFFEAMGMSKAVTIINEGINKHHTTELGTENDATSLENMKATVRWIKECNEIRKKEGLSELQVNGTMMAIAQVQLNHTNAMNKPTHSGLYDVGENLAYAYGPDSIKGEDPFEGLYYSEKKVYDYVTKELGLSGKHEDVKNLDRATKQKIVDALGLRSIGEVQTGHYLNIVNPNYTGTGFAQLGEGYDSMFGQVFTANWNVEFNQGNMSVDAFFDLFNTYYDKVMGAQNRYDQAVSALETMRSELNAQITALQNANSELTTAQNAQTQASQNANTAQAEMNSAKDTVTRLENEIKDLEQNDGKEQYREQLAQLKKDKATLNEKMSGYVSELDALHTRQQENRELLAQFKDAVDFAQKYVKEKEDALSQIENGSVDALNSLNKAKENLKASEHKMNALTTEISALEVQIKDKTEKLATLTTQKQDKENTVKTIATALGQAEKDFESAKNKLDSLVNHDAYVQRLEKEIAGLKEDIKGYNEFKDDAPAQIGTIVDKINALKEAMQDDKAYLAEIKEVKANYEALLKDPSAQIKDVESKHETIAQLNTLVRSLQDAYSQELEAKDALALAEEEFAPIRTDYNTALSAYKEAKEGTRKAMNALQAYLDAQKAPSKENGTSPQEETKKQEGTPTSVATGISDNNDVWTRIAILAAGGGFTSLVLSRRKKNEKLYQSLKR